MHITVTPVPISGNVIVVVEDTFEFGVINQATITLPKEVFDKLCSAKTIIRDFWDTIEAYEGKAKEVSKLVGRKKLSKNRAVPMKGEVPTKDICYQNDQGYRNLRECFRSYKQSISYNDIDE